MPDSQGTVAAALPQRHAPLVGTLELGQPRADERDARLGRRCGWRMRGSTIAVSARGQPARLVVGEDRGVLDPQFPRALETVHNLRRHHAAVVLETQRDGPAAEDGTEEPAPASRLSRRVGQHVERRHRHHLNVGRRVELLHVREQLRLVRGRQQRRREDQIGGTFDDGRDGGLHRGNDHEVGLDVLVHERGQHATALGIGFDSENASAWTSSLWLPGSRRLLQGRRSPSLCAKGMPGYRATENRP